MSIHWRRDSGTCAGVFSFSVQSPRQKSINVTDGEFMQHITKMWREAKTVDSRAKRLTSWVHLDYWTKALVRRNERVIIQNAEMDTLKKV